MKSVTQLIGRSLNLLNRPLGGETALAALGRGTYTVIDWMDPSVSAHEVVVRDGRVELVREFHARWPDTATPQESPDLAAEWLRQQLKQVGITAVNTIVCVPRRSVSLRLLEFPIVEDDELAALVMLQLETRTELLTDDRVYDYLPLPFVRNAEKRHVLMATMPRDKWREIVETTRGCGLNLLASGIGELAVDALTDVQTSGLTLNVLANHAKVEFVLSHGGAPLASHSARMPHDGQQQFAESISNVADRMVAALPESLSAIPLVRINLMGPHANALLAGARQHADCDVRCVPVAADHAVRPLALATCLSVSSDTVNFQSPRQPAEPGRARKQQLTRFLVGAIILVGLVGYCIHDEHAKLQGETLALQDAGQKLEELNQRGASTIEAWRFVDAWKQSTVDWSRELQMFSDQLPKVGTGYLTQIQLEHSGDSQLPLIRADGLAQDSESAMAVNRKLMQLAEKYEVQPHGIEPGTSDAQFQAAFRVEVGIRTEDVATAVTEK